MKVGFLFRLLFLVFPFYSIAYATTEEEQIIEDITSCENPEYEIKTILFNPTTNHYPTIDFLEYFGYSNKINDIKYKNKLKETLSIYNTAHLEDTSWLNTNYRSINPVWNKLNISCGKNIYHIYFWNNNITSPGNITLRKSIINDNEYIIFTDKDVIFKVIQDYLNPYRNKIASHYDQKFSQFGH